VNTPIQKGIAKSLKHAFENEDFFKNLSKMFKNKCDLLYDQISNVFGKENVFKPSAGYFIIARVPENTDFGYDESMGKRDFAFGRWLIKNIGITGIPYSVFHTSSDSKKEGDMIRFCFAKTDDLIEEFGFRLKKFNK
jgi:aspartate/methionine/tyrosine aminotransferase